MKNEDASERSEQIFDGRYRIVDSIAQGGMATVYHAIDERLDRDVAVKVIHTQLAQGPHRNQFTQRFKREAQSAAAIANPHIVQVYDAGEVNGLAYLVMEYVHGVNLRHTMNDQQTFSVRQTLRIIEETLEGLASAHQAGIAHRDIKPENILINDRGHIQITDFGLAKAVSQATSSSTDMLLGTAAYVAPEVIEHDQASIQADLYSVGVVAWEMLAGTVPFTANNPVALVFKHVHDDIPPISQACPGIHPSVEAFIARLSARIASERPSDGSAALEELQTVMAQLDLPSWNYRKQPAHTTKTSAFFPQVLTQHSSENHLRIPPPPQHQTAFANEPLITKETARNTDVHDNSSSTRTDTHVLSTDQSKNHLEQPTQTQTTILPELHTTPTDTTTIPQTSTTNSFKNKQGHEQGAFTRAFSLFSTGNIDTDGTAGKTRYINTDVSKPNQDANPNNTTNKNTIFHWKLSRPVVISGGTVIGVLIIGLIGWWYYFGPQNYWTLPKPPGLVCTIDTSCPITNVAWQPYEQVLKKAGIPYTVRNEYNDTIAEGNIIATTPDRTLGRLSKRSNEHAIIIVSRGIRQATIPADILDPTSENAKNPIVALKKAGFTHIVHKQEHDEYSLTLAQGILQYVYPQPGTTTNYNKEIIIQLSKGPMPVVMPDVVGHTKQEAQEAFDNAKLKVTYTEDFSDTIAQGQIISASVAKGSALHWGDEVSVKVSKGPQTAVIPNLTGKSKDEATKILQDLGFKVNISAPLGDFIHIVRTQSPHAGEQVRLRDSAGNPAVVTLTVI